MKKITLKLDDNGTEIERSYRLDSVTENQD